jgi:ParB family chromosome partitioning protein
MTTVAEPQLLNALLRIPLDLLDPGPNVRAAITGVDELASSIRRLGMQKPLLVIDTGNGRYRILDGHRRYAAAKRLGLDHVDAVLRREAPEVVRIQQQLAIQGQTEGFDPIAEAKALYDLMFVHKMSREDIAAAVGRSPGWVRDRISLVHLDEQEKRAVAAGRMPVKQALLILACRRAERSGAPHPAAAAAAATPREAKHCRTCKCGGE